ncbi:MAG TPA: bifunctional serine/threonine-protein kinase/formylglycine-generating enzyme family protein [Pyrinomonadaceae bacterium]
MRECQLCKSCFTDDVATCPNDGMPTAHTIEGPPVLEGKYHLDIRLGQGGMGVVYKARHAYLKTLHAIKIILPDLVGNDPQLVTRFRQEALAAAAIRHQNVVNTTDYGVINGNIPFLVMEYVEGESLHDLLAREKKLDPERAFDLISAICAGVGAAHHQGIVHRDLKPLNIMICSDKPSVSQAVKILDFGLAKIKSGELLGSFIQAQTTGLMGSPYYMAPEQWSDDEPDSRSDIYSLGVMLFQMLAGDVPFKGSSIPAIMKKHISDPPPAFAELGISVSPEVEQAVRHTLQKEPDKRTSTVEDLVEELKNAIYPPSIGIHTTGARGALPVSSLTVRTEPARSFVFVDNVAVGPTRDDGTLLLEGIQSGNHHLRISHEGFDDWLGDVNCDGKPQRVLAELRSLGALSSAAIPMPGSISSPQVQARQTAPTGGFSSTGDQAAEPDKTILQSFQTGSQRGIFVDSQPPPKHRFFSPLVIGGIGVVLLFFVGIVGLAGAYFLGVFPHATTGKPIANGTNTASSPTPGPSGSPVPAMTPDMVSIPGGTFKMGNNHGRDEEKPEHQVSVNLFMMDRTEVTNEEYLAFVTQTGYKPLPSHWVNDQPKPSQEKMPVRDVNIEDVNAFIAWRSKRDGVTYRLPTEEEWEYTARNGSKGNLFPWGDSFQAKCAVVNKSIMEPAAVATASCADDFGVYDLIGNVYEWTASKAEPYPGATRVKESTEPENIVRGGCAENKSSGPFAITSTSRIIVPISKRDLQLGFRLVRSS